LPSLLDLTLGHRLGDFSLDVTLMAESGPLVIIGPSGAGKTLILRSIAGIIRPDRGHIAVHGRTLFDSDSGVNVAAQDRRVGYVPQEYALFPHLTVAANLGYGLRGSSAEKKRRVAETLELVGLVEQSGQRPRSLSGGQRQRVALGRALAVRPDVLLLDEPFSALDAPTRESLLEDVRRLIAETQTPTIIVTHDRNEAMRLADTVAVIMDGRIRQVGTPAEVFAAPVDENVAGFVGIETVAQGRVRSVNDGVAQVQVGAQVIEGGSGVSAGDEVLVCLRPEDVVIGPPAGELSPTSARNHLSARVVRFAPSGPYLRVYLVAGFPLVSLITRSALDELGLEAGSEVMATFKATAVHLIRKSGRAPQEERRDT
jgi:molybdate transport system ATP-binding protein